MYDDAVRDTVERFEATGSPVVTDGEQRKPSFATYPVAGLTDLAGGGVTIPFEDGHTRQLPVLTSGAIPLRDLCLVVSRRRPTVHRRPAEAGRHLRLRDQPHVPGGRHRRLPARGVHRGPRPRGVVRDARLPRPWRDRPDRLHRGAPVAQARSVGRAARRIRRPEQPGPRRAHRRGAVARRRALVPGRRPGLDPQRRCRLRRAAAGAVPPERGLVLRRDRRARPTRCRRSGSSASAPAADGSSSA